jgi:hypothetical protein
MLREERKIVADDINFRLGSAQTRGVLCSISATAGEVEVAADPSGARVVGVLLMDTVNAGVPGNLSSDSSLDTGTASNERNFQKNETYVGGVVRLCRKGEITTDAVDGAVAAGDTLYLAASGQVSATQATGAQAVGHALSAKDSDGFVKMFIDC